MSKLSLKALLVSLSIGVAAITMPMHVHAFGSATLSAEALANPVIADLVTAGIKAGTLTAVTVGTVTTLTGAGVAGLVAAAALAGLVVSNNNNNDNITGTSGTSGTGGTATR